MLYYIFTSHTFLSHMEYRLIDDPLFPVGVHVSTCGCLSLCVCKNLSDTVILLLQTLALLL